MSIQTHYQSDTFADNGNGASMAAKGSRHQVTTYFGTGVTFDSGTLTLMVSPDGGTTWVSTGVTVTSATASTKVAATAEVYGNLFRWTLTGSTTPTLIIATKLEQISYEPIPSISFVTNGSSDSFRMTHDKAALAFTAIGTWDSGSLTLQASPDGGTTWFKVGAAVTANSYNARPDNSDLLYKFVMASVVTACAVRVDFMS